jgi:hypothetical protein
MARGVGHAYVRWTEALRVDYASWDYDRFTPQMPFRERLVGVGVQFRSTSRRALAPTVALDAHSTHRDHSFRPIVITRSISS